MGVYSSCFHVGMAGKALDQVDVGTGFDHMCEAAMPQKVGVNTFVVYTGFFSQLFNDLVDGSFGVLQCKLAVENIFL